MINVYYLINFLECGHFCLNYILKKDKKKVICEYDRKMMNLSLIQKVLNEYYKNVVWYKNVNIDGIKGRCVSLIKIRKKYYHYIVIERVNKEKVYYYDPMFLTLRREKTKKFIKKWSNLVCIYS